LTKPHESRHVAHGDRRLFDQQLRGDIQTAREQVLAEGDLAELGVRAGELTRRAGERACDSVERQGLPVVAHNHNTGLQIQAATLFDRRGAHTPSSDRPL
jgi:hypothetical protein